MVKLCLTILTIALLWGCTPSTPTTPPSTTAASVPIVSARGMVDIAGGILELHTPIAGQVDTVSVVPGTKVQPGQLLAVLHNADLDIRMEQTLQEQTQALVRLHNLQAQHANLERLDQLQQTAADQGLTAQMDAINAHQALLTLQGKIAEALQNIQQASIHLKAQRMYQSRLLLRAPIRGIINSVQIQTGQWLQPEPDNRITFSVIPEKPLIIRAEVNESFVNRIHRNEPAEIRMESLDNPKTFQAHILYIGARIQKAQLADIPQMANDFECVLRLDIPQLSTKNTDLHLGQTVLVTFL